MANLPSLDRPWTRREVADFLRCSERQVRRDTENGIISGVRIGHRWYYDGRKILQLVGLGDHRDR